ncbi:MAG: Hsp70 family protein [Kofleriaceae bacterium]|nr:Hsp70 family protein [Kofleriaceae bacterium]
MMVERAVISVPALFELPQSAATSEAARLAGFERVELLQEPIASALAAGDARVARRCRRRLAGLRSMRRRRPQRRLPARDPRRPPRGWSPTTRDNFLGGRDLDWAITEYAQLRALARRGGPRLERRDPTHAAALRCARAPRASPPRSSCRAPPR